MKSNNYLVTYDDLTTMGLTTKSTPPTGNRIATKSFINTYYYVNNTGAFASYANNQCVMYQDIVGIVPSSATFYYTTINTNANPVQVTGFAGDGSQACAHASGGSITAYYYGSFGNGTALFYDTSGTFLLSDGNYFSMNGSSFLLDGASIYSISACAPTTYSVTIHAKQNATHSGRYVWYSTNGGSSYTRITSPAVTTSDQSFGSITVNSGTTIILAIGDSVDINDGTTAASVGVGAYAALPSSCPGRVSPPAIYANQTVYLYGNSSGYDLACT